MSRVSLAAVGAVPGKWLEPMTVIQGAVEDPAVVVQEKTRAKRLQAALVLLAKETLEAMAFKPATAAVAAVEAQVLRAPMGLEPLEGRGVMVVSPPSLVEPSSLRAVVVVRAISKPVCRAREAKVVAELLADLPRPAPRTRAEAAVVAPMTA